jgi:hypothetical protein
MFGNIEIAKKIEAAEARLAVVNAEFQRAKRKPTLVHMVAGGVAVFVSPQSPMNKVIGIGLGDDNELEPLAAIEDAWKKVNEPVRIELCSLAFQELSEQLAARAYKLQGFENVLAKPLKEKIDSPPPIKGAQVEVVKDQAASDEWIAAMVVAFCNPDRTGSVADPDFDGSILRTAFEEASLTPGFRRYLARMNGKPASAVGLRMDGDLAQLAGAGTIPAFRGKGLQKMLLQQRLLDAQSAGCVLATVTTAPGSRSQQNMMRHGFELLYSRAIFVRGWEEAAEISGAASS